MSFRLENTNSAKKSSSFSLTNKIGSYLTFHRRHELSPRHHGDHRDHNTLHRLLHMTQKIRILL
jgi:hypothetical protein